MISRSGKVVLDVWLHILKGEGTSYGLHGITDAPLKVATKERFQCKISSQGRRFARLHLVYVPGHDTINSMSGLI